MASIVETVGTYAAAWGERDEAKRRRLLEAAWAEEGVYSDPTALVAGREALVAHIGDFHARMPGARIRATSGIDTHHDHLRFTWAMDGPDGAPMMEGVDFGEVGLDGRLRRIVGFFGPPPA